MTITSPDISLPRGVSDFLPDAAAKIGYIEGKNLVIEWRYADGVSELWDSRTSFQLKYRKYDAAAGRSKT